MTAQIIWGSVLLGVCSAIHLVAIVRWLGILIGLSVKLTTVSPFWKMTITIGGSIAVLVFSHTVQVWIWAVSLIWLNALSSVFDAIYFSLVTYTTLGYGDVTLTDEFKIFGAMASVTGLLNFGVSTAVLVSVLSHVLPEHLGGE